jgi:hypothetical protein
MVGTKRRLAMRALLAAFGCFVVYAGVDLLWPVNADLRGFDPASLGAQETGMWRAYYERKPVLLFFELSHMLRSQFGFPPLRSILGAIHASRAAFVFKDGKSRIDYERSLPMLREYFSEIHRTGNIDFDVERAASTELEWWIVHRERDRYSPGALGKACAEAASALYGIPPESTLEHGKLRAAAMIVRDTCAASGGVSEENWRQIDVLLESCYQSLHRELVPGAQYAFSVPRE